MVFNKKNYDLDQLKEKELDIEGYFSKRPDKYDKLEQECKEKYGNDWWEHYLDITIPNRHNDHDEECINRSIYTGGIPLILDDRSYAIYIENKIYEKLKRMFGSEWKQYINHKPNDPKVNEALIKDAIQTDKWRELPKELQEKYHKLVGK